MIKLKLTLSVIIALCFYSLSTSAQVGDIRHNFALGVNGGINLSTVSFQKHRVKQNMLMAPTFGVTARYISEKYFAMICGLQVELNYSQLGWDKKFEFADGTENKNKGYTHKLNYLQLPFLAHLAFGRDYGFQFFINLGPQIGYMISDSYSHKGLTDAELEVEEYGKAIQNKFDYGIVGGGGVEIRTRKLGSFIIEGRYYYGLSDFYNSAKKDYFARSSHNTITAKITYLFDITK